MEALKLKLKAETDYLTGQIAKFEKYLFEPTIGSDMNGQADSDQTDAKSAATEAVVEQIPDYAIGNIRLAVGQSNLFINERFKQFANLIVDSETKRGEKEVTLQDLEGFWEMINYQVDDLKVKWVDIENLRQNNWIVAEPLESVKPKPLSDKVNIKNRKPAVVKSTTTTTDKPKARSNFREFLRRNKTANVE